MHKKQILKYLPFFLLFQNINLINATEIVSEQKNEIIKTKYTVSTKDKIQNLFSNLKDNFYSSKSTKNKKEEEVIKNLEEVTKYLSIAHTSLKLPQSFRSQISNTSETKECVGDFYSGNLFALRICKKIMKATTETDEPISLELIQKIEKFLRKYVKEEDDDDDETYRKKWNKMIAETIKLVSLRASNKLIKSNIENRKIRRLIRTITTSLIITISKEVYKTRGELTAKLEIERATYKLLQSLIVNSWIEFIGETIIQNIENSLKEDQVKG